MREDFPKRPGAGNFTPSEREHHMDNLKAYAEAVAGRSLDPSTKVGAILRKGPIDVQGYNRMPVSAPDYFWHNRELKYKHVIHAEVVAILRAGPMLCEDATLVVSTHPCRECAKLIAYVGISRVVCPLEPWRDDPDVYLTCRDAREIFDHNNITVEELK